MTTNTVGSETLSESLSASSESQATDYERFFLVRVIDALLAAAKVVLSKELVLASCRVLMPIGMWALLAFAGLLLISSLVNAIDQKSFAVFGAGLAGTLVVLALMYSAGKFCNAGSAIIDSTPSEMSSRAFLDCLALLAAAAAVGLTVVGFVGGIEEGSMLLIGVGLALGVWMASLAAVALNPSLVNMSIRSQSSAGNECLGIVAFGLKFLLRTVPAVFGAAATIGTVLFLITILRTIAAEGWQRHVLALEATALIGFILVAAALPLLAYLVVIIIYLLVDLARSILRIRGAYDVADG